MPENNFNFKKIKKYIKINILLKWMCYNFAMNAKAMLKKVYSKEYLILICIGFLPLLWKVLEIAFISGFENALKILGQISLISIVFKVFQESILNPLYKLLGKDNFSNEADKVMVARRFLLWYLLATIIFSLGVFLLIEPLMKISQVPNYIFSETIKFLKVYVVACGVGIISSYLYTFNVINKHTKKMFYFLLIKAVATAVLLFVCVPKFMLNMGVMGVAVSELLVNVVTTLYLLITFPKQENSNAKIDTKQYFKLFLFAFLETAIRNVVYYFVILVLLNMIDTQDLYFVSNDFIWSVMLVPAMAQNTLIRQEIANNSNYSLKPYFLNCVILIGFIAVLMPLSVVIFKYVYNLANYLDYFIVLLKLLPCYFIFVIDSVVEAYFFATGKLHHILIQNILTNIGVYLTAFILLLCNVWVVSLDSIIFLFNLGVVVSSVYTISVYLIDIKFQRSKL